ncbi:hypothetical protein BDF22DRAFT_682557 [Syncephalis plumigaleata]|nr:hypothetical protein BDF22DRAFT_682557 [Syncephalis plumigaleata]
MDTIHKKTLKANNNNNSNNNSNDNSNKKKDAHLNRIVARAIEQIPQQELPDTIIPLNADTPINNESESKLVTGNDNNFAELGAIIGRMLENAVTGRAQESMDVLFLRLVKQVIITLESHNPSFEIVNKSVMDEALETVKKATDAALVTLQQQQHHHQQANSNNKPLMDATNMMFAASVGPTVQPADFKEFDTSIAPETAVLTESKTTLIPITSSLKEELIQKKQ